MYKSIGNLFKIIINCIYDMLMTYQSHREELSSLAVSQALDYLYIILSGGPLLALTCCVNVRLLLRDKIC